VLVWDWPVARPLCGFHEEILRGKSEWRNPRRSPDVRGSFPLRKELFGIQRFWLSPFFTVCVNNYISIYSEICCMSRHLPFSKQCCWRYVFWEVVPCSWPSRTAWLWRQKLCDRAIRWMLRTERVTILVDMNLYLLRVTTGGGGGASTIVAHCHVSLCET
jgi:hypothetical protein